MRWGRGGLQAAAALALTLLAAWAATATAKARRYRLGDPVPLVASKIGPFANPTETYDYYDMP